MLLNILNLSLFIIQTSDKYEKAQTTDYSINNDVVYTYMFTNPEFLRFQGKDS